MPDPNFKDFVLRTAREVYGDSYNESWNDAEKKAFLDKYEQKCRDYKKRAENPPAPQTITETVTVVQDYQRAGDALIKAGDLMNNGKL